MSGGRLCHGPYHLTNPIAFGPPLWYGIRVWSGKEDEVEEIDMMDIRKKLNRTRKQMADLLGVSYQRVYGMEFGSPRNDVVVKLRRLGIIDNLNRFQIQAMWTHGLYD